MENENKWTRANRVEIISGSEVLEAPSSRIAPVKALRETKHPRDEALAQAIENSKTLWMVVVHTHDGLNTGTHDVIHFSKEEALAAQEKLAIGSEYGVLKNIRPSDSGFVAGSLSFETSLTVDGLRGEAPYELIYDALHGCGVYEGFKLSKQVINWIGDDGARWLREKFGENWESVAALEYCVKHFPSTSMAVCAARIFVSEFVAQNDFDAGFASAELKAFDSGAEEIAVALKHAKAKRAITSGEKSARQKKERIEALLQEIEALSDLVERIPEPLILKAAWENLEKARPDTPKTKSTREDYEASVKFDPIFRERYNKVFAKNA